MAEPLPCVVTNGGPLIALPTELVDHWHGTDGAAASDYERGCDQPANSSRVDDSWATWTVAVGAGQALMLEGECSTAALPWGDDLVLVRDVGLRSEAEVHVLIASIAACDWIDAGCELELATGGLSVFDSAYPGVERDLADGGVLELDLVPGRYRVAIAFPREGNDGRTTLIRLALA